AGAGRDVRGDGVAADAARRVGRGGVAVDEVVAVLGAGEGAGEGWVGVAVGLGLVVGLDGQRRLGHGQRAIGQLDVVVGEVGAGAGRDVRGDGVAADAAGQGGGCVIRVDEVVAVLDARDGAGEGGVGVAVGLGLVVGLDRQRRLRDGEGAIDQLDVVVGEVGAGGGRDVRGDGVAADAAGQGGGCVIRVDEVVAVLRAGDGAGQGGDGDAVGLGVVVGLDGQRRLGHGQRAIDQLDVGVGEAGAGAGRDMGVDRVRADSARVIRTRGVAVDEVVAVLGAGDGAGEGGVGVAVGLGLVVRLDRQRRLGH